MDNASIRHVDCGYYYSKYRCIGENKKVNRLTYDVTTSPSLLITMGFSTVTSEDCRGYISHAGYNN